MKSRSEIESGVVEILLRFAVTVGIGLAICGIISMLAGCARKQYVPLQTQMVRVDTVTRLDTVYRSRIENRHDTVYCERVLRVEIRDSVAPRYGQDGEIIGYDRYRYEKETDNSREERARLTELVDSLSRRAVVSISHNEELSKEIPVHLKEGNKRNRLFPLIILVLGILYYLHFIKNRE